MTRRLMILLLLAVQATMGGCGALLGTAKPQVSRRYAMQTMARDTAPRVKITVFSLPTPPTPPTETSITSLGTDAQAELVRMMSQRTPNAGPQGLAQALALPIRTASSTPSFRDMTRLSRRLVFSLDNPAGRPANRISEARIHVHPDGETRFVSWNRIENIYEVVDIGKLSLSQERSAGAELGLTLPVLSATPALSASAGSTLQEEILLRHRRTALTGALTPDSATLVQQGGAGIDLTGNVTADFEFVVPSGGDHTVFVPALPDSCIQPSFNRQTIRYPRGAPVPLPDTVGRDTARPADITANVTLEYTLRDVARGHETITESDDYVVFRSGDVRLDNVLVIPGEVLRFSVFELRKDNLPIFIQGATQSGPTQRIAPLQFANFEDAVAMLRWVRRCTIPKVGFPLLLEGTLPMRAGQEPDISIWRVPLNYAQDAHEPPALPAPR